MIRAIEWHLMTRFHLCDTCAKRECYRNSKLGKAFLLLTGRGE